MLRLSVRRLGLRPARPLRAVAGHGERVRTACSGMQFDRSSSTVLVECIAPFGEKSSSLYAQVYVSLTDATKVVLECCTIKFPTST